MLNDIPMYMKAYNSHRFKFRKINYSGTFLFLLCFLFLIGCPDIYAGDKDNYPEKGKIVDTVRCKAFPKYSYALYLPPNYSDTLKWPIIYIFDPGAGGKRGVSNFSQAAEKYGYILICSNNSRNGLLGEELTEVLNTMFTDVESRFAINPDRIYTSGFSGGSRVAALVALNSKNISGVIACGAGFPSNLDGTNSLTFEYIGLVGNRDMNYLEMCELEKKLDSLGVTVELRIFEGIHDWPPPDILLGAVEWLELRAMYKGTKSRNDSFLYEQFEKYTGQASSFLKQGKLIEFARCYKYIINDFPDYSSVPGFTGKLDSVQKTGEYKKLIRKSNKDKLWEQVRQYTLMSAFNELIREESMPDSIYNWWTIQINSLKKLEVGNDTCMQIIAERQLNLLLWACYESGSNLMNINRFKAASICYQLESMITPENKYTFYRLARAYALSNETNNSLKSLGKAIKLGYNNKQSIEKDIAFISIQSEKRYNKVLSQLK